MPKSHVNPSSLFRSVEHGFSQVVVAGGSRMVFVSGQTAWDRDRRLVGRSCAEQTRQAFRNVQIAVREAGGSLTDIVALRIYVVDLAGHVEAIGAVLKEVFPGDPPASTWIGVTSLAVPEFLVEVEAVAVLD